MVNLRLCKMAGLISFLWPQYFLRLEFQGPKTALPKILDRMKSGKIFRRCFLEDPFTSPNANLSMVAKK